MNGVGKIYVLAKALGNLASICSEVEVPTNIVWNFANIFKIVGVTSD